MILLSFTSDLCGCWMCVRLVACPLPLSPDVCVEVTVAGLGARNETEVHVVPFVNLNPQEKKPHWSPLINQKARPGRGVEWRLNRNTTAVCVYICRAGGPGPDSHGNR